MSQDNTISINNYTINCCPEGLESEFPPTEEAQSKRNMLQKKKHNLEDRATEEGER